MAEQLMRVMVVGASTNREKFGNKAVRAYQRQNHEVFPVNPRAEKIEGLRCYPKIADPPGPIHRATIYLPPKIGVEAVRALADRGDVGEVWLNPGADGPEVVEEAEKLGLKTVAACSITDIGEQP